MMLKKLIFGAGVLLAGNGCAISDYKEVKNEVNTWYAAEASSSIPDKCAKFKDLDKKEVTELQSKLWQAYKQGAVKNGADKYLMGNPPTLEEIVAMPKDKRPKLQAKVLKTNDKIMPYIILAKGKRPANGWPLFICLHGGGRYYGKGTVKAHGWDVNSREWQAQMSLTQRVYKPSGLYFIPRMADDRMGRWFHKHNIELFTKMIKHAVLFNDVDPNRIYIMGISQGGYGTCHLAPFMADLFAGAGAMAGGMNTVTPNLRNLPFRTDIGERDTAYKRITLAKELHHDINALKKEDPQAYKNVLAIQKGRGHGIDYKLSPSWLEKQTRQSSPKKVVWNCFAKDGVYRKSFYWLALSSTPKKGEYRLQATADSKNNSIEISAKEVLPAAKKGDPESIKDLTSSEILVNLNDHILDLDKEVKITVNGKLKFSGKVPRRLSNIMKNLKERGDINYAFPSQVRLKMNK